MKIFVVEDDLVYQEFLSYKLTLNPDNEVEKFTTGSDLMDNLYRNPSIITLDYRLPDMTGEDLLKKIKARKPDIPVIIISSQDNVSTAINLLKKGAYDYIVKDEEAPERLWNSVRNISANLELQQEVEVLREEIGKKYDFRKNIHGESQQIHKLIELLEKAVKTDINISIFGETGTGKEVVAKAIHYNSSRKNKNFVAVNMAAIPRELIESELFGHEKGAFTGAVSKRKGKFEEAHGGTIFLDEIGELDLSIQAKLLRVLQENEVTPVGGNNSIRISARLITATHKNLAEEVKKGNFRKDLFYRLIGMPVEMPPLSDRGNDILILAKYFLNEFSKENNLEKITIAEDARTKLLQYHYPGNVRELKSVIDLAAVMSENNILRTQDINFGKIDVMEDFLVDEDTLNGYTRKIIRHYLDKYDRDVMLVAKKLDMGKSTIYQMIKNMDV